MHRARPLAVTKALVIVASAAIATGCGESIPQMPTTPTPTTFTEVFSGTINLNGAASHPFISQGSGTALATLTALTPDAAGTVGISLGTWDGSACSFVTANDKAVVGTTIRGIVGGAGQLCARVYDVGTVSSSQTYELTVVHP
jgi:hypothetical protein